MVYSNPMESSPRMFWFVVFGAEITGIIRLLVAPGGKKLETLQTSVLTILGCNDKGNPWAQSNMGNKM